MRKEGRNKRKGKGEKEGKGREGEKKERKGNYTKVNTKQFMNLNVKL